MSTANPPVSTGRPTLGRARQAVGAPVRHWRAWRAGVTEVLDRPLTSYYLLVGAAALLLTIGLIMVLSASSVYSYRNYHGDAYAVMKKQLLWVVLGLPCAAVAMRLNQKWVRRLAWPSYLFSMGLLLLTAFIGVSINGNQNWLRFGPVSIQPSEIAKLSLILWTSHIFARKERRLGRLHEMLFPVLPGFLVALALVLLGKDLGTALVIFSIMLGLLWVVGAPKRFFFIFLGLGTAAAFALAYISPERMKRLTTFTHPFQDFQGAGWQAGHGLYALATGGWFGEGIGASRQKWGQLPEAHTDFIFAVLGEELGLIGTLLVIGLFLAIAYACIRIAMKSADPFVRYMTFGILVWLLGQMIINVGMVLTVLPVIGLPLPLVSYGGSALVPSLVALGIVIGFARKEPEAARALAARRRRRSAGLSAGASQTEH